MLNSTSRKIAIVGGGFSGLLTAINLVRLSSSPLSVTIINQAYPTGRGIAYGTRCVGHLLNVAARNMSAFPDLPDHFLQWLRTRSEYDRIPELELRERFIPRLVYGDYLRSLHHHYLQGPLDQTLVQVTFVEGEAIDVEPRDDQACVHLRDGARIDADRVLLATGNEAPAELPGSAALKDHPRWIGNPWQPWEHRLPDAGGVAVILGTGLTTVDAVITLQAAGWKGTIQAISRHGWLPHSHFRGIEYPDFPPPGVDLAELGLRNLLALVEDHCERLRQKGANPAIIVDKMRPYTQRIWQKFTKEERREFLRHHAARWNILRHRIAPEIHARLSTAQETGQLQLHAGSIQRLEPDGDQILVHLDEGKILRGDVVINATGPNSKLAGTNSVLLRELLQRGLIIPDETEMGVRVDADHTVIDRERKRSGVILALGPLLRGTLWETIAVPELRTQARRAAETLLDRTAPEVQDFEPIIEYLI